MAGDLLDDELLALAGGSDSEDRPRKTTAASSSSALPAHSGGADKAGGTASGQRDDADDGDADPVSSAAARKRASAAATSTSKRRRLELLDDDSSDSDMDASGSDDGAARAAPAASSRNKSGKKTTLRRGGRAADSDSDDADQKNPFPYQGLYKDAEDYERLMAMNELAREEVISERKSMLDERKRNAELRDLFRQQQAAAGATRKKAGASRRRRNSSDLDVSESDGDAQADSDRDGDGSDYGAGAISGAASAAKSRKKKAVGATETKTAKLSELRKKRKEKASGASTRRHDSDDEAGGRKKGGRSYRSSSDESSSESADDYEDDDAAYGSSRKGSARKGGRAAVSGRDARARDTDDAGKREPPSLADLNGCRISRDLIEQKLYAPKWKEALKGAFIRFSWGVRDREDGMGKEQVYRIHQVLDVIEKKRRFYDLSLTSAGKWCNVYLVFDHLGKEHEATLTSLSRSPFTDSERDRWIRTISAQPGVKMPRKRQLEDKAEQLDEFFNRTLTEADIGRILEIKKEVRKQAKEAGYVDGQSHPSQRGSNGGAAKGGDDKALYDEHVMAAMNDRNRKADRERIVEAERKAARAKREALKLAAGAGGLSGDVTPIVSGGASTPVPGGAAGNLGAAAAVTAAAAAAAATGPTTTGNGAVKGALGIEVDLGDF